MNSPTDRSRTARGPNPLLRATITAAAVAAAGPVLVLATPAEAVVLPSLYGAQVIVGASAAYGGPNFTEANRERREAFSQLQARSRLKDAKLDLAVITDRDPPCRINGCSWGSVVQASQWEVLTFNSPGVAEMPYSFTITGIFPTPSPGSRSARGFFYFGTDIASASGQAIRLSENEVFSGAIRLGPGITRLYFYQAMQVSAYRGSSANYYSDEVDGASLFAAAPRGAGFSWQIPKGVTYTSSSGEFMTAGGPPAAVPESATWAMMILGFGGSGAMLRRRVPAVA